MIDLVIGIRIEVCFVLRLGTELTFRRPDVLKVEKARINGWNLIAVCSGCVTEAPSKHFRRTHCGVTRLTNFRPRLFQVCMRVWIHAIYNVCKYFWTKSHVIWTCFRFSQKCLNPLNFFHNLISNLKLFVKDENENVVYALARIIEIKGIPQTGQRSSSYYYLEKSKTQWHHGTESKTNKR